MRAEGDKRLDLRRAGTVSAAVQLHDLGNSILHRHAPAIHIGSDFRDWSVAETTRKRISSNEHKAVFIYRRKLVEKLAAHHRIEVDCQNATNDAGHTHLVEAQGKPQGLMQPRA